jgi:hypothetical protein
MRSASRRGSADLTLGEHLAAWRADAFLENYVCWREASEAARAAYERWRGGERRDRSLAFAAYKAALDQEEHAAIAFHESTELVAGPPT